MTVVVQGGLSPLVSRLLGVRQPENNGWVIVGANPLARLLGGILRRRGEDVVLMDTNPEAVNAAQAAGLRVVLGNASEERTLLQGDIESRRGLITLTPNESINLFLARRANELFHVHESIVGLSQNCNVSPELVEERGNRVLFGRPVAMQQWHHRVQHGMPALERWRFVGEDRSVGPEALRFDQREDLAILPLAVERAASIMPVTDQTRFLAADLLYLARPAEEADETSRQLEESGWRFAGKVSLSGFDDRRALDPEPHPA